MFLFLVTIVDYFISFLSLVTIVSIFILFLFLVSFDTLFYLWQVLFYCFDKITFVCFKLIFVVYRGSHAFAWFIDFQQYQEEMPLCQKALTRKKKWSGANFTAFQSMRKNFLLNCLLCNLQ